MKCLKKTVACVLLAIMLLLSFASCGTAKKNKKNMDPTEVLEIVCEAINEQDMDIMKNFIYKDFNDDMIHELIYDEIDYIDSDSLPIKSEIVDRDKADSDDIEDIEDEIIEEYGVELDIQKAVVYCVDDDEYVEIALIMIKDHWYVLAVDY